MNIYIVFTFNALFSMTVTSEFALVICAAPAVVMIVPGDVSVMASSAGG